MTAAGTVHVFSGPTLSDAEIHARLPAAIVHPPVAHGDVLALQLRPGDTVAIIDGLFYRAAPVRHKEILHLLGSGVRVLGAASMGALRAAELGPFGMLGVGTIARLYSCGVLDGDDEVAVLHGPPEEGYPALSLALVDFRCTLRRMRHHRLIDDAADALLRRAAKQMWFGERRPEAIAAAARDAGLPRAASETFQRAYHAHEVSLKRRDARRLVRRLGEPPAGNRTPSRPAVSPTWWLRDWLRRTEGETVDGEFVADQDVLTFAQAFAEDYPQLHHRVLLNSVAEGVDEPGGTAARACRAAREHGVLPPGEPQLTAPLRALLTAHECDQQPAAAVALALVRSYRQAPGMPPVDLLVPALRACSGFRRLQESVAGALRLNRQLRERNPRFVPERIPDERALAVFTARWQPADLPAALRDRGFSAEPDYLRRARLFAPVAILRGVPVCRLDP